ncbi:MAG: hypothetical protein ACK5WL_09435 [Pseudanabaena sp.]|jgi:membrane-anchored protein YejM (alkaline phosphatase superfamily)
MNRHQVDLSWQGRFEILRVRLSMLVGYRFVRLVKLRLLAIAELLLMRSLVISTMPLMFAKQLFQPY